MVWLVRRGSPAWPHTSRTCSPVMVARIALPAAEEWGISRCPSGVWNRTLPGPSTRSMKTGNPSSQTASREVIFVRSDSSMSSGRQTSPSGSWPRAMSPSRIRPVPREYLGPGCPSRSIPKAVSVRASERVVLLDVPSDLASSLSGRPSAGPSATIWTSRIARATLRTVYRPATSSSSSADVNAAILRMLFGRAERFVTN